MIFAREISDPLTSLVKKVDEANKENSKMGRSFVVLLNDDEGIDKKLKDIAEKEKLQKVILATFGKKDGPEDYNINKDADVTVIMYVGKKVKSNHAFKKGEFKTETVDKLLKDLPKILDK
jgi:hypothetical protein